MQYFRQQFSTISLSSASQTARSHSSNIQTAATSQVMALKVNCGYARTAIRELTRTSRVKHQGVVHKSQRANDFHHIFNLPTYQLPSNYFDSNGKDWSLFDKHCDTSCKAFLKKWTPTTKRVEYTNTFSIENWKALPEGEKNKHTLSNCRACFSQHENIQRAFPLKPVYIPPPPVITVDKTQLQQASEKEIGRKVLSEVNLLWQENFCHPITKAIPKIMPEANLIEKESKSQRRVHNRKKKRKIVQEINQQLSKNATMSVLAEAESLSSYKRKRLSYSFDSPIPAKRSKSHSPNEKNLDWDITSAMEELQNFPKTEKINWSSMARRFNVQQKNPGQVLKEVAQKHGIDTKALEQKTGVTTPTRIRRRKAKLRGGAVSMPCLPTKEAIVNEKYHLINSGVLSIGEPCSPYTLKKTTIANDGTIQVKNVTLCGRKIPLLELRQRLLQQHQQYMRLTKPQDIEQMTKEEILSFMISNYQKVNPDDSLQELQLQIKNMQHTRTIAIWHDHSTILNTGYILFAVWVVYDKAVFLTEEEYKEKSGVSIPSLQPIIEVPEIYMIAPSSSSPSDQLALINDRIDCLQDLSQTLSACNEEQISDKLRFFCGDKPAQQFERGTQIGGIYKCGGCGCKDTMMSDLSHAFRKPWRSLTTLQQLVTSGKYGNIPSQLKPLDNLKVSELREELHTRGVADTQKMLKPELQEVLSKILQGAQRVPTLLSLNPTQPLSALNLNHYEILDCEPLHDIKGHLYNLLPEIPNLFCEPLKSELIQVLETTIPKQKVSGAILRTAAIKLLIKLHKSSVDGKILSLLDTIVRISQLLYLPDIKRSPKMVLRLYNCTWFHHELCKQLFPQLKTQTLTHFFGIYLHAIVVHAPLQFQIMSLSSLNAESQERLFSQAKRLSLRATNRKSDNVLPTILVGIQARQKMGGTKSSTVEQESIVKSVSSKVPTYTGTAIEKSFINKRLSSWQAHLERISTYLICGQGIWWEENQDSYIFYDSDSNVNYHPEGPTLMHFRDSNLSEVETLAKDTWKDIVHKKTPLPSPSIKLYDDQGNYKGTRKFSSSVEEQMQTDTTPDQTFTELTETEYETLQQTDTESIPSTTSSEFVTSSLHSNHHISLLSKDLCVEISKSSSFNVPEEQEEDTDEHILNMTVEQSCTIDPTPETFEEEAKLQTKAAKLIQRVTGQTQAVLEFDFLRNKLKLLKAQNKRPSHNQKDEYTHLVEKLHQSVISIKDSARKNVRKFEQDFYDLHGTFPGIENTDSKQLRKKLDYAKYICSIWSTFSIC